MLSDPIVALATPAGRSALALIRLSGKAAFDVAARALRPFRPDPPRVVRRVRLVHPDSGELVDDALAAAFPGPRTYTGDDLVEITTHGGLLVPAAAVAALVAAGARPAAPGEFTRRAVLNGKLDLLQAEATADLIDAGAPAQARRALHQLDRGLSARLELLRAELLELEALIAYEIDFPEEDEGPVAPERVERAWRAARDRIAQLLATAPEGERLREGALVVIAGRPNAGKSSLFNALLGTERAIVTEIPGTTRDAIEAHAVIEGFPFRLADTAGLRDSGDRVERLGIEVSRRYLGAADLVLYCEEAGDESAREEFLTRVHAPVVVVRTKIDLRPRSDRPTDRRGLGGDGGRARGAEAPPRPGGVRALARPRRRGARGDAGAAPHGARARPRGGRGVPRGARGRGRGCGGGDASPRRRRRARRSDRRRDAGRRPGPRVRELLRWEMRRPAPGVASGQEKRSISGPTTGALAP